MVSFDLSTTNIALTAAVVGLFVFFILLLMKLNPSREEKEDFETEVEAEGENTPHSPPIMSQKSPEPVRIDVPRVAERPLVVVGATMGGTSVQTRQETPVPLAESREPQKPEKTVPPAKTGFVPARRDCLHHFGYLRSFPKNSPIPDECFGCEKIVDCLVNTKKSK